MSANEQTHEPLGETVPALRAAQREQIEARCRRAEVRLRAGGVSR